MIVSLIAMNRMGDPERPLRVSAVDEGLPRRLVEEGLGITPGTETTAPQVLLTDSL